MPVWKLQCAIYADSLLARDPFIITPHFNDEGVGSDPQGLCDDLADQLVPYFGTLRQIDVKAYDAQGTVPVFPAGSATRNAGLSPSSFVPREVALCLSFFAGNNTARRRGRLYMPMPILTADVGVQPSGAQQQKIAELAPILEGLGGVDVDWSVYSRVDDVARPVTNWWVDNEWDTMRSRGLRSTARLTGTTSEA